MRGVSLRVFERPHRGPVKLLGLQVVEVLAVVVVRAHDVGDLVAPVDARVAPARNEMPPPRLGFRSS